MSILFDLWIAESLHSWSLTARLPLRKDGWKTILSFLWWSLFRGELLNFRGVTDTLELPSQENSHHREYNLRFGDPYKPPLLLGWWVDPKKNTQFNTQLRQPPNFLSPVVKKISIVAPVDGFGRMNMMKMYPGSTKGIFGHVYKNVAVVPKWYPKWA